MICLVKINFKKKQKSKLYNKQFGKGLRSDPRNFQLKNSPQYKNIEDCFNTLNKLLKFNHPTKP